MGKMIRFGDKTKTGFSITEISGTGLGILQKQIEALKKNVSKVAFDSLGRGSSLTIIDAEESQNRATSFLVPIAEEEESKFNDLYRMMVILLKFPEEKRIKMVINKQFEHILFGEKQLNILLDLVDKEVLSKEAFLSKLKTIGILPSTFDLDKNEEEIRAEKDVF